MAKRTLTKTDFKRYLICPKDFWLSKNDPDKYVKPPFGLFEQKLSREGYQVEAAAKKLFHDAEYERPVQTEDGFYAELDMMRTNEETGKKDIYEIKSSSEIKTDLSHNHIKDITFQVVTAERSGVDVGKSFVVHINKKYVKDGDINIFELFEIEDVTDRVNEEKEQVGLMMDDALRIMNKEEISFDGCECLYRSHGQRCTSFKVFNPNVPDYSVHHIVGGNKLKELLADGILDVTDIPEEFELTEIQSEKVTLQKIGVPMVDKGNVEKTLEKLVFPLYFFDYESLTKPIPLLDGYKTNQQLVFQFSLHKLHEDGKLEHFEYLADDIQNSTKGLVKALKSYIGPVGSIIVWYEAFEKGRNRELGVFAPRVR